MNGSRTYNIYKHYVDARTKKQKTVSVEKISGRKVAAEGKDPEAYVNERLEFYRRQEEESKSDRYITISRGVPVVKKSDIGEDGEFEKYSIVKNLGYAVYSRLYHSLELDELINNRRRYTDAQYNANVILQHLVYSRMLWPGSKLSCWRSRDMFHGHNDYSDDDVYRCMDDLLGWRDDIIAHLDGQIRRKHGRKGTLLFYDVTNYYFEVDDDDEEGEGDRARGAGKEHRPSPIIQMGLFMDELGLPITYELYRGNVNDCITFADAVEKPVVDLRKRKKIVIADKGMMTYSNILRIRKDQCGYVISQSIRKSDEDTKKFCLDDGGWTDIFDSHGRLVSRYKERIVPRKASSYGEVDESKHSGIYNERQVFIWSEKYQERARHERKRVIEKAEKSTGMKKKDTKDFNKGKSRYEEKQAVGEDGLISEIQGYLVALDEEQISKDEQFDGYYLICTNVVGTPEEEVNKDYPSDHCWYGSDGFLTFNRPVPATEIMDLYGGLWRIEETFKVTKTGMMKFRPVFHHKQGRIRAHFLICFIALVLERILERSMGWKYSAKSIQDSLSKLNLANLKDTNMHATLEFDQVCYAAFNAVGLDVPFEYMSQDEVRRFIAGTKKKDYE